MAKTSFKGVYTDKQGQFYYEVSLGTDKITGKIIKTKGLRRSHASYLINVLNANVLMISKRLGHSSPDITLKHYAHMWTGVDKEIALDMTGRIKRSSADQKLFHFNGNQAVNTSCISKIVSKDK